MIIRKCETGSGPPNYLVNLRLILRRIYHIDFRKVVYALKKAGFDRTISFEVFFGGEKKFRDSVNRIKKLWKEV